MAVGQRALRKAIFYTLARVGVPMVEGGSARDATNSFNMMMSEYCTHGEKNEKRYFNRDIYHCTVECLKRMDIQYRKELESTTFKQPELRQVVAEMNMRKRTRSETS